MAAHNEKKNEIVIAFRGTVSSSIVNWLNNLDSLETDFSSYCDGCYVHSGFFNDYNDVLKS